MLIGFCLASIRENWIISQVLAGCKVNWTPEAN